MGGFSPLGCARLVPGLVLRGSSRPHLTLKWDRAASTSGQKREHASAPSYSQLPPATSSSPPPAWPPSSTRSRCYPSHRQNKLPAESDRLPPCVTREGTHPAPAEPEDWPQSTRTNHPGFRSQAAGSRWSPRPVHSPRTVSVIARNIPRACRLAGGRRAQRVRRPPFRA